MKTKQKPSKTLQESYKQINEAQKKLRVLIKEHEKDHGSFPYFAPKLETQNIQNCRLVESRLTTLKAMPKNGVVLEVGTQYGGFAKDILSINRPKKLHLCDINFDIFDKEYFVPYIEDGIVELHEGRSHDILQSFPDDHFDWIYIDGGHNYATVKGDAQHGKDKVKEGGYLVFNDYTSWSVKEVCRYGVMKAVNELCLEEGWELRYLALQELGYHDVALKKIV
ncbi:MAG: class I SAM-dependent methyltransferase [Cyanobacteria bacterium P01_F01_bin.143]